MSNETPLKSSTSRVKTSQFTPHGVVDLWMEGRLMHYEATGPFNTELVDCLAVAQRDYLVSTHPEGAWVSVCNVVGNAMSSPEGIARYAAIMAAPKPGFMIPVATAFVIAPDVEGGHIMAPRFTKIYADIGRLFRSSRPWRKPRPGRMRNWSRPTPTKSRKPELCGLEAYFLAARRVFTAADNTSSDSND